MTLGPLILALCVNAGPTYNDACKAALEQGASQSGLAGNFEKFTSRVEKDAIRYIDSSKSVEITAAVAGYAYQLASGHQANLALPNPGIKNSSMSLGVGKDKVTLGLLINF